MSNIQYFVSALSALQKKIGKLPPKNSISFAIHQMPHGTIINALKLRGAKVPMSDVRITWTLHDMHFIFPRGGGTTQTIPLASRDISAHVLCIEPVDPHTKLGHMPYLLPIKQMISKRFLTHPIIMGKPAIIGKQFPPSPLPVRDNAAWTVMPWDFAPQPIPPFPLHQTTVTTHTEPLQRINGPSPNVLQ
jgi:hypothetical protein